jgi:hypothetical protein
MNGHHPPFSAETEPGLQAIWLIRYPQGDVGAQ